MEPIDPTLTDAEQFALLMDAIETLNNFHYANVCPSRLKAISKAQDALISQAKKLAYSMAIEKFEDSRSTVRDTYHDELRAQVRKAG